MTSQSLPSGGAGRAPGLRVASALLAAGGFALLAGAVFLLPFALSPYAIQNDVYMANLFLAPLFILAGGICIVVGLVLLARSRGPRRDAGRVGMRALLLAALGAAAVAAASFLFGGRYESMGPVAISWPPYLNLPLLAFALVVGAVVCILGWIWGASQVSGD
ncbi:MAG TPA: hypothetical protein VFQ25_13175 [Ktedonobacterales bacterium]|nr:hypothetical protein [Ktedonobacterales bacterium]